ncbi:MAG: PEGA domain-containing protein [Lachnospiraceae bacterium]
MNKNQRSKNDMVYFFFLFSLLIVLWGCGKGNITVPDYDDSLEPAKETSAFCIVTDIDEVNEKIELKAVGYATEYHLSFTGGTDIRDKYGDLLSISNVELGSIVDIVYDANKDKLLSMSVTNNESISKMQEISGAVFDFDEDTIRFQGQEYLLAKNVCAFSDNKEIGLDEICSEDQLTVWFYNNTVCSIYVELGHGYVKLKDYESYLGGTIEIGYDVIETVTEDMLLTVREGDYTLRISKGNDSGTKEVTVLKNQEISVSLKDIAIEPKETGSVLFAVTPSDAAVYIDDVRVNTEGAVEIPYGKHRIYIVKNGYQSYSASFNVNYAYKIKKYTLIPLDDSDTETNSNTTTIQNTTQTGTTQRTSISIENNTIEDNSQSSTDSSEEDNRETKNKVTVLKPVNAHVYLDGKYIGIAPISFTKVTGSHIITLSMSGYLSKSYTVTFKDDGSDKTLEYDDLISIASLID